MAAPHEECPSTDAQQAALLGAMTKITAAATPDTRQPQERGAGMSLSDHDGDVHADDVDYGSEDAMVM